MKMLRIGAAIAALAAGTAPATAQTAGAAPATGAAVPAAPPAAAPVRVRVLSDRVMTRSDVDQHIRKVFARFDANHDGFVTREEVDSATRGMMARHRELQGAMAGDGAMMGHRAAMFDRLDANHDGSISRQEFMTSSRPQRVIIMREGKAAADGPAPRRGGMHMFRMGGFGGHLFEIADTNRDGRLSLQEAETAALAHFDRADLNHDGKLTPEERQQAHQAMRQQRPS